MEDARFGPRPVHIKVCRINSAKNCSTQGVSQLLLDKGVVQMTKIPLRKIVPAPSSIRLSSCFWNVIRSIVVIR